MSTVAGEPRVALERSAPKVMSNPTIRWDGDPAELPRISIVTPCFNHADYVEATLRSVLEQGYPKLEYVVIDGGSTDSSTEIIARYKDYLSHWESGPDDGQYHAIQRGFDLTTGEIMLWLNSDDMLHRNALWTVASIFMQLPRVEWLMGVPTLYDHCGRALISRPRMQWSRLRYLRGDYRFIQQESVVWRRRLWERAGGYLNTSHSMAADMELWMRFFRHARLYSGLVLVGGFRKSPNQRTRNNLDAYLREAEAIVANEPLSEADRAGLARFRIFDRLWLRLPLIRGMWRVRHAFQQLFDYPPLIVYNDERQRFELKPEVPSWRPR